MHLSMILAAGESKAAIQAEGWFLSNVWLIPAIMAASFALILFFGKRMPKGGSELGIAAVGVCFLLALVTAGQWVGEVNRADNCVPVEQADYSYKCAGGGGEQALGLAAFAADDEAKGAGLKAVVSTQDWWSNGGVDFTIGTMVDGLTVTLLVVVTLVSLLVHIYSTDYVAGDRRYTHFFAFLSLFTSAMLFFVTSENILQMIVGWELVGVCSFALIGHWWEDQDNSDAALKAFLTNRVGDMGLLIGMIILFFASGQKWGIIDVNKAALNGSTSHTLLLIASLCLLAAVMSKSGQFFLHTWLPDAMAGPTPVSALIHAATMVVAGVYLIARLYGVFWEGLSIGISSVADEAGNLIDTTGASVNALAIVGGVTTLVGASLAFVQDDIKKVLAYSTISQLGYMTMALGVGAWTAAVFHLTTHAFFKACLFLGAGSVSHAVHSFDMKKDMGGMRKFMPTTYKTFLIGSIALAGLPPLAGFWSKDEILVGTGGWGFFEGKPHSNGAYTVMLVMGMITAAMTAAYMTRVMYLTFFGEFRGGHHDDHGDDHGDAAHAALDHDAHGHDAHDHGHDAALAHAAVAVDHGHDDHDDHGHHGDPHESGPRILWPLRILAFLAVTFGFVNLPPGFLGLPSGITERFGHYVEPSPAGKYFPKINHADPSWSLAIFSTLVVLSAVFVAYNYYFVRVNRQSPTATELVNGLTERNSLAKAGHTMLKNRYYLDHIYDGGEPVGAAGSTAMGLIFGTAAGAALGFSLDNGLNQDFWPSLMWGAILGLVVFAIVRTTLATGVGIATFVKRPLADASNWVHENVIDGAVDTVGETSVKAANFVYDYIDQGVIDTAVNTAGTGSTGAGGALRRLASGKVQQYATIMFAGATLLAGLLIIVI